VLKAFLNKLVLSAGVANVALVAASARADAGEQRTGAPLPGALTRMNLDLVVAAADRIGQRIRASRSPDELTSILSEQIDSRDFAVFAGEFQNLVRSDLLTEVAKHGGFEVSDDLVELRDLFLLCAGISMDMLAGMEPSPEVDVPDVASVLYGRGHSLRMQEALEGGLTGFLALLALGDDDHPPPAEWLRIELRQRAEQGMRQYAALLVAWARQADVAVPESPLVSTLAPFDLDQDAVDRKRETAGVRRFFDKRRRARGA
jgi:hypothetical protein